MLNLKVLLMGASLSLWVIANSAQGASNNPSTVSTKPYQIYWQHSSGLLGLWKVNTNGTLNSAVALPELGTTGSNWELVTGGDFDKNGHDDLLWLHSSGAVAVWYMQETNRIGGEVLQTRSSGAWKIVGATDLDSDTNLDILWQHPSGRLGVWYLTNSIVVREAKALDLPIPGSTWDVVGVLDLDNDGDSDFLWQHRQGSLGWWEMEGVTLVNSTLLPFEPVGPTWRLVAVKDLTGDPSPDFVWQNNKGDTGLWEMQGLTRVSSTILPLPKIPNGWQPKNFRF